MKISKAPRGALAQSAQHSGDMKPHSGFAAPLHGPRLTSKLKYIKKRCFKRPGWLAAAGLRDAGVGLAWA